MSLLRGSDWENNRFCPWELLVVFLLSILILCSSRKHLVRPVVACRDDAAEFDVVEAKVRCAMRAACVTVRFLEAVAKHRLGADMARVEKMGYGDVGGVELCAAGDFSCHSRCDLAALGPATNDILHRVSQLATIRCVGTLPRMRLGYSTNSIFAYELGVLGLSR